MRLLPFLEGVERYDVAKGLLRQVLVAEPDVAVQRRLQVVGAVEVVRSRHLG